MRACCASEMSIEIRDYFIDSKWRISVDLIVSRSLSFIQCGKFGQFTSTGIMHKAGDALCPTPDSLLPSAGVWHLPMLNVDVTAWWENEY